MRRTIAISMIILVGALAACSSAQVPGTDGDLVDDWGGVPAARGYTPEAGVCHQNFPSSVGAIWNFHPVDCAAGNHYGETVYVGQLGGVVAALPSPPKPGDATLIATWRDCDRQATAFVGRTWSDGRLDLQLVLPTETAWTSGARWYRCDLTEITDVYKYVAKSRYGSLKGKLDPAMLLGCFAVTSKGMSINDNTAVSCTSKHNAEYVGSIWSNLPAYPTKDSDFQKLFNACFTKIDRFMGSNNVDLGTYVARAGTDQEWRAGYRVIRCYLWLNKKSMSKSANGSHGRGVPNW